MAKKDYRDKRRKNMEEQEFAQKIIDLARVTRVMAGGKRMRFRACLAIGDGKGRVGVGIAKGADVTLAVAKAYNHAKKNVVTIPLRKETIPHEIRFKFKASDILYKPAPKGTGIKAGGAVRVMLELAGVPNVVAKIMGTNNKVTNAKALVQAMQCFKEFRQVDKSEKKNLEKKVVEDQKITCPPKLYSEGGKNQ